MSQNTLRKLIVELVIDVFEFALEPEYGTREPALIVALQRKGEEDFLDLAREIFFKTCPIVTPENEVEFKYKTPLARGRYRHLKLIYGCNFGRPQVFPLTGAHVQLENSFQTVIIDMTAEVFTLDRRPNVRDFGSHQQSLLGASHCLKKFVMSFRFREGLWHDGNLEGVLEIYCIRRATKFLEVEPVLHLCGNGVVACVWEAPRGKFLLEESAEKKTNEVD